MREVAHAMPEQRNIPFKGGGVMPLRTPIGLVVAVEQWNSLWVVHGHHLLDCPHLRSLFKCLYLSSQCIYLLKNKPLFFVNSVVCLQFISMWEIVLFCSVPSNVNKMIRNTKIFIV